MPFTILGLKVKDSGTDTLFANHIFRIARSFYPTIDPLSASNCPDLLYPDQ